MRRGELVITVDGAERTVRAGDEVVLPPGTVHHRENREREDAYAAVEYRPALRS